MPPSSTPAGPPCLALRTTCGRGVAVDRWPLPLPVPHSAPVVGSPPRGTSVLPPLWKTTRAPTTLFHFGALSRGLRARCLRFAVRLATAHARLACRWWPAFRCAGLVTRRAPSKFQPFTSWHPLLQAWPGAISMETSECARCTRHALRLLQGRASRARTRPTPRGAPRRSEQRLFHGARGRRNAEQPRQRRGDAQLIDRFRAAPARHALAPGQHRHLAIVGIR
jgi:hypothetical protein